MKWDSLADFLHMGGYGHYVWWSYGMTALLIIIEMMLVRRRRDAVRKRLLRLARLNKVLEK